MSYRRFTKEFKEKVLRELVPGQNVAALARRYAVSRQLIYEWQEKQRDGELHDTIGASQAQQKLQIEELERKVGQLTMENDFLKKTLQRLEQRYPQSDSEKHAQSGSARSRKA